MEIGVKEILTRLVDMENRIALDILLLLPPQRLDAHVVEHDLREDSRVYRDLTELEVIGKDIRTQFILEVRDTDKQITGFDTYHLSVIIHIDIAFLT